MRAARCWGEDPETRGWNNEGEVGVTEGTGHRTMRTGQTMGGGGAWEGELREWGSVEERKVS